MSLVRLYGARDTMEAQFVCDLLKDAGIDATVMGGVLGAARGDLPMTVETLPGVYIRKEDSEAAMAVLDDFKRRGEELAANPPEDWACPACGEINEGQFTQCWNCETDRPRLV